MTDFEMLSGRPAHCEDAIAQAVVKKLEVLAMRGAEEPDIESVAVKNAKKCGFNKALINNAPKGKRENARYAYDDAKDRLPTRHKNTEWDVDVQETECYDCKLCKKTVVVTKPDGALVGSFILATHIE